MDLGLEGKIAFVTGAGSGIGRAIAELLAAEGAKVYVTDLDDAAASAVAASLVASGGSAVSAGLDVGEPKAVRDAITRIVAQDRRLDIAVNNAGILRTGSLQDSTLEDWDALSRINVAGVYTCCAAAAAVMSTQRYGKIVNLGSVSAFKGGGSVGSALYGASKAAVTALTKGFAREYGPMGVNVNAVAPAVTETPMTRALLDEPGRRERILGTIPLRRLSQMEEVANLVVFLVSDVAGYINGSTVVIDGGLMTA